MRKLKVYDLFSGIGGFSLGLERAGMVTVGFCEIDPNKRRLLNKHWPGVPVHEDIRTLKASDVGNVDLLCGGFPCQDISFCGLNGGLNAERSGLWKEFKRLIRQCRPGRVVIENVAALRSRGLDEVLRQISALGYDAEWHCIPATAVGLPHQRDRVWIVAYHRSLGIKGSCEGSLQRLRQIPWNKNERRAKTFVKRYAPDAPKLCRGGNGVSKRLDALGDAVIPEIPYLLGLAILEQR